MSRPFRIGLYLLLDRRLIGGRGCAALLRSLLGAGARWFQYRDKTGTDGEAAAELARLGPICREAGARLIVNDRPRLAVPPYVDGVHLGASDTPIAEARRIIGPGKIIGRSARTAAEAVRAREEGADYVGAGALRPTGTKGDAAVIGVDGVRGICRAAAIPVIAIGGITLADVGAVLDAGASGIAVASAVILAPDPEGAARGFIAAIARFDEERRLGGG
jgi:thiamine-phosphate diphosphorylase